MTLSVHCEESVAIGWRTRDATATAGQDYTAVNSATHVFEPGSGGAQCGVNTMDDATAETDETFTVEVVPVDGPEYLQWHNRVRSRGSGTCASLYPGR